MRLLARLQRILRQASGGDRRRRLSIDSSAFQELMALEGSTDLLAAAGFRPFPAASFNSTSGSSASLEGSARLYGRAALLTVDSSAVHTDLVPTSDLLDQVCRLRVTIYI